MTAHQGGRLSSGIPIAITILVGTIALFGCSLAPDYVRGKAPVPESLSGQGKEGELSTAATTILPGADISIEAFFPDQRLVELIRIAFLNNRDLRLSILNIYEARAQSSLARSNRLFDLEARASDQIQGGAESTTTQSYETQIMLPSFELDFFSRLKNLESLALEDYLATQEDYLAFQVSLIGAVANSYVELRTLAEKEELIQRTIKIYQDSLAFVENRVITGQSDLLALEEARSQVEFAQAELYAIRVDLTRAENTLKNLLGDFSEHPELPPPKPLKDLAPIPIASLNLPSEVLLLRPDIQALEHRLIASHYDIGAARAAFFPSVSLTGALGFMSMDLKNLFSGSANNFSFTPAITLPLFTGGRNRANLSLAEVRRDKAVANYEKAIIAAFKDVADALWVLEDLSRQEKARAQYLATQQRVLELVQNRYQGGTVSYLEVLDAQEKVYGAQEALLDARKNLIITRINLFSALGGGLKSEGIVLPLEPN
ncbi:MAG: efflux transporter outer membrane subunit [Deltaproteobacteria bacterium]|jgi:NodT family efflux transporter outer membrane factor (OMF) lipoprotein|nr:efflux transporter outer membrane subunit [Deltaproteobacteria bacterium]